MSIETISVIGLGYIGLPTAAMFAARKIKVIGVDVSSVIVDTINQGKIHIVEPELDMIVHAAVKEGYLRAALTPEPADVFIIAVPTPFKGDNHEPDLKYIHSACLAIAPVIKKGDLIVLESTSPVGTTEKVAAWLADTRKDLSFPQNANVGTDVKIAYCPERVLPGHILRELVQNDRLIGGLSDGCSRAALKLYKTFVEGECFITNARTAEMAKLTENSFRDVNIAFANELSMLCDEQDINVWELIELANRHPRVNILKPGPGVGGHCIAVDPWFIINKSPETAQLIRAAREVNLKKVDWVVAKVKQAIADFLVQSSTKKASDIKIACFGITFKPDIDDIRESPALNIAKEIEHYLSAELLIVEPNVIDISAEFKFSKLHDKDDAINAADIVLFLVGHKSFNDINQDKLADKIVVDTIGLTQ